MRQLRTALGLMAAMTVLAVPALAQPAPNTEGGRYSFVPVREGLMRLDVKSGEVSTCAGSESGWACHVTPDERATFNAEIERLRAEAAKLKADLAARGPSDAARADAAKDEAAKAEAIKAEALAKSEAAKADAARAEAVKAESARAEAMAKAEAAKAEAARAEAVAKAEAAKAEVARETAKAEASKAEAAKALLAAAELAKAEAARQDIAKADAAKAESARQEAAKADAAKTAAKPSVVLSEQASSSVSRAWRQFVETVNRLQRDIFKS